MAGRPREMDAREASERFALLVEEYRLAGWIGLGKITPPGAKEAESNLGLARLAIDTLGMLEAKTKGNLTPDEERLLGQALTDLRINFVDEMEKERRQGEAKGGELEGGGEAEGSGSGAGDAGAAAAPGPGGRAPESAHRAAPRGASDEETGGGSRLPETGEAPSG